MNPLPILPGLAAAALLAGAAQAAELNTVQLDKSQITFVSRQMGVQALGKGRFEARGQMTIKGRSHEVVAPFISSWRSG